LKWLPRFIAAAWLSYSLAVRRSLIRSAARLVVDPFEKKRFLLPLEVTIVLAINLVVAVLGYYAVTMWGLFRG
jgi:hypothetical protein